MNGTQFQKLVAACFVLVQLCGCAQTGHHHAVNPAYRPHSEYAATFVESLEDSAVAVYPAILRAPDETAYSEASQRQAVSLLNEQRVAHAVVRSDRLAPAKALGPPQWDIFVADMHAIEDDLKAKRPDADYAMVMEFLFPPDGQSIWGIHCYIFDRQGNNAFSFLLNSHHPLFANAALSARDASSSSRARMVEQATAVAVRALTLQVNAPTPNDAATEQGYSITSQTAADFDGKVERLFVVARIHQRLVDVVMHAFKHSLISAFESNGVTAVVKVMPRQSSVDGKFDADIASLSPDAVMRIDIDPLLRTRKDGYEAVVGTVFHARAMDAGTRQAVWEASGKVDYIQERFFNSGRYTAHAGIRKEFAWHTTAAIVRTFTLDVNGHESAPIYTVTEERQLHRQRTD